MKHMNVNIVACAIVVALVAGCSKGSSDADISKTAETDKAAEVSNNPIDMQSVSFVGTIVTATNAGRYVYFEIETEDLDEKRVWVAAMKMGAKPGDKVTVGAAVLMVDFYSPTLKRTFANIFFAGTVLAGDRAKEKTGASPMPAGGSSAE